MKIYKVVNKNKYLLLLQEEDDTRVFFLLTDLYQEKSFFCERNFFPLSSNEKLKKKYYIDTSKRYRLNINSIPIKPYTDLSDVDQKQLLLFLEDKENPV